MTDLEISKALALAIGWKPGHIKQSLATTWVYTEYDGCFPQWEFFDHTDWNVIGPIAAKHDAFPMKSVVNGEWHASCDGDDMDLVYGDTAQKAIALAVIQGAKT